MTEEQREFKANLDSLIDDAYTFRDAIKVAKEGGYTVIGETLIIDKKKYTDAIGGEENKKEERLCLLKLVLD